ncbi:hypothetical protein [Acinetobacter sp. ANC 5502]
MTKKYKALDQIGRWQKGDIVGYLPESQISQLLKQGLIEEVVLEIEFEPVIDQVKQTQEVEQTNLEESHDGE